MLDALTRLVFLFVGVKACWKVGRPIIIPYVTPFGPAGNRSGLGQGATWESHLEAESTQQEYVSSSSLIVTSEGA